MFQGDGAGLFVDEEYGGGLWMNLVLVTDKRVLFGSVAELYSIYSNAAGQQERHMVRGLH